MHITAVPNVGASVSALNFAVAQAPVMGLAFA